MENKQEETRLAPPALDLKIDDEKLAQYIKAYREKSTSYFNNEIKLDKRRKINERFIFGRQFDVGEKTYYGFDGKRNLKSYEKPFLDNVLKEGEDKLRSNVLSRIPDLFVKPGTKGDEYSQESADKLTELINKLITSREKKKLLSRGFRHHGVYFTAVLKYRWDKMSGQLGENKWEVILPENILVDHTATEANEECMHIIIHYVEKSIKEWIMLFPKKEDEIKEYAQSKGKFKGLLDEKAMAVNLKIPEAWFDWKEKVEEFDPENPEFKNESGVCWILGDKLLDKRRNPNWDYEGETKLFYNGQPVPDELLPKIALLGNQLQGLEQQQVYRNYFKRPRKPFIFFSYDQWGKQPYDETSRIEENILGQQNYDERGMQITKMIDDAHGKHIWSSMSGLQKKTIEKYDLNDPEQDVIVEGDLRQVHAYLTKEQPSQQMFQDLVNTRERILSKLHVHGATRGEVTTSVATTNQIAREGDTISHDEISDDMINDVVTQIAEAEMHMLKLRGTDEHFQMYLGEGEEDVRSRYTYDMIEDGMEVDILVSGTNKLKAERQAKDEAQLQMIEPINYYKDTGRENPEERAEMLFLFQTNPELYYKKYIKGEDLPDIAEQIMMANQMRMQQMQQVQPRQFGQQVGQAQQVPSAANTTNIATQPQGGMMSQMSGAINRFIGR